MLEENTEDPYLLRGSQLSTTLPSKEIVVHHLLKTSAVRNRQSSKCFQFLFLNEFGSSDKGKENVIQISAKVSL